MNLMMCDLEDLAVTQLFGMQVIVGEPRHLRKHLTWQLIAQLCAIQTQQ